MITSRELFEALKADQPELKCVEGRGLTSVQLEVEMVRGEEMHRFLQNLQGIQRRGEQVEIPGCEANLSETSSEQLAAAA